MLTAELRKRNHDVVSFVENNFYELEIAKTLGFDQWVNSEGGRNAFEYDTNGATKSDFVIYISPSGKDAAAEVGAAWASGIEIWGLYAKGEDFGLMRRMVNRWFDRVADMLQEIDRIAPPHH